jgi:hypothetical protein
VTHHGVSQTLYFLEIRCVFLAVFGDKKVSRIPESHVGIRRYWLVQASNCHVTTHVFHVTKYKKCTQTLKITPYFLLCHLFIWHDLQDLKYDQIVLCIPFQYMVWCTPKCIKK